MPELPIGEYGIEAKGAGFQTVLRKGIALTVGSQPDIDLQLKLWSPNTGMGHMRPRALRNHYHS